MYDKTGGTRVLRRAGALAVVAAVAALATACGGGTDPSSASSPSFAQEVALAHCLRSHGEPNFPDPPANGQGTAPSTGPGFDPNSPRFLAAVRICQHVLPAGAHVSIGTHVSAGTNGS
jgi:Rieske Fe-S protein